MYCDLINTFPEQQNRHTCHCLPAFLCKDMTWLETLRMKYLTILSGHNEWSRIHPKVQFYIFWLYFILSYHKCSFQLWGRQNIIHYCVSTHSHQIDRLCCASLITYSAADLTKRSWWSMGHYNLWLKFLTRVLHIIVHVSLLTALNQFRLS